MARKIMYDKENILAHATSCIIHNEHNEEKTSLLKVQGEDLDQVHVTIEAMKALCV